MSKELCLPWKTSKVEYHSFTLMLTYSTAVQLNVAALSPPFPSPFVITKCIMEASYSKILDIIKKDFSKVNVDLSCIKNSSFVIKNGSNDNLFYCITDMKYLIITYIYKILLMMKGMNMVTTTAGKIVDWCTVQRLQEIGINIYLH